MTMKRLGNSGFTTAFHLPNYGLLGPGRNQMASVIEIDFAEPKRAVVRFPSEEEQAAGMIEVPLEQRESEYGKS